VFLIVLYNMEENANNMNNFKFIVIIFFQEFDLARYSIKWPLVFHQLSVLLFLLLLISCNGNNSGKVENDRISEYILEKVDSFKVDRETKIRILDYSPTKDVFLAYDLILKEFLLIDQKGEVLESINRMGEGPNEYLTNPIAASFDPNSDGYLIQSSTELIWYSNLWEVEKRFRFSSLHTIMLYSGPKFTVPFFNCQSGVGQCFFTNYFPGTLVHQFNSKEDVRSKKLIEYYNPSKNSLEWGLSFDPQLVPSSQLNEKELKLVQVYALNPEENNLYLSYQTGIEIGVYDLSKNFDLKDKIKINQKEFSMSNKSKNTNLIQLTSGQLVLLYFTGISETVELNRKERNPYYLPFQEAELYRFIVITDGVVQENEIRFPGGIEPHSEILPLPQNRILLRNNTDGKTEAEFSEYSIYEFKPLVHSFPA